MTIKHSAHFVNALKKEKERLQKRRAPLAKKIEEAEAQLDAINEQINGIDEQLGVEVEMPLNESGGDEAAKAA